MLFLENQPAVRKYVPILEDGSPEMWDGDQIDYMLQKVELSFDSTGVNTLGEGSLYITKKRVIWIGNGDNCFDFDVPYIVLHAVNRDLNSYPKPCIYCQLDSNMDEEDGDQQYHGHNYNDAKVNDYQDDDDENDDPFEQDDQNLQKFVDNSNEDEMYLIPESEADLMKIFDALSRAEQLNPDPIDYENEESDELIYSLDEVRLGIEQQRLLNNFDAMLHVPDELKQPSDNHQFEDANER